MTGVKFHPGHYAFPALTYYDGSQAATDQFVNLNNPNVLALLQEFIANGVCPHDSILGVQVYVSWKSLEGDTAGDFSDGFALVDGLLNQMANCSSGPKHLMLTWQIGSFVYINPTAITWAFPAYLVQTSGGGTDSAGTYGIYKADETNWPGLEAWFSRYWTAATADRVIAVLQAYGARYDTNPGFEMLEFGAESAMPFDDGSHGFSYANMVTQLERIFIAFRAAWPHTAARYGVNWADNDARMQDILSAAVTSAIGVGGPDTIPHKVIQSNCIFAGGSICGFDPPYTFTGGTDRRGIIPFISEVESPSMCNADEYDHRNGKPGGFYTNAEFVSHAMTGNGTTGELPVYPTYFVWHVNNDGASPASCQWGASQYSSPPWLDTNSGGIFDFIQTNPVINSTCPSLYTALGGCKTN